MNRIGVVLLWLNVVVIIPAAIVLTTMTLDVRSKWLADVEQRRDKVIQSRDQLRETRLRVRNLEQDLQAEMFDWGDVWRAPQSSPRPGAPGAISLSVGLGSGLGLRANQRQTTKPNVFVFQAQEGQSNYLGEFRIDNINAQQASAQLVRSPYPGELQGWGPGVYRIRSSLPSSWRQTITDLDGELLVASSKLRLQQLELQILTDQIQKSQESLEQRLAELNGDPNAPVGASQDVQDGLVETLRRVENDRNQLLAEVNSMRYELDAEYVRLTGILGENRGAVDRLLQMTLEHNGSPARLRLVDGGAE